MNAVSTRVSSTPSARTADDVGSSATRLTEMPRAVVRPATSADLPRGQHEPDGPLG